MLFVTSLADSGPGTLRAALGTAGPRTVVFRVGGSIVLRSPLRITEPYVTVAGQTAPGDGIQIYNDPDGFLDLRAGIAADSFQSIEIDTHDVVLRHLRVRPGPLVPNPACTALNAVPPPIGTSLPTCVDANDITPIDVQKNAYNVVIDHASLSWSSDELLGVHGATDVTLQWSVLSEGMNYVQYCGYNSGTPCSASVFWGTGDITGDVTHARVGELTQRLSFHHNAFAHNSARNPQMTSHCAVLPADPVACAADVVNNVVYNWRFNGFGIHDANLLGHHYANWIGNYTRKGADQLSQTNGLNGLTFADWTSNAEAVVRNAQLRLYVSGNRRFDPTAGTAAQNVACSVWDPNLNRWNAGNPAQYLAPTRYATPPITTTSAETALTQVLADSGANRRMEASGGFTWNRDANDRRVLDDIANGTGQIIDSFAEFPGRPALAGGAAPSDVDLDGMPDLWETGQCLDPQAADDRLDPDGDVYTNLEEYLNGTNATSLVDTDGDGVRNACDNCPSVANPQQQDRDADGIGNSCDPVDNRHR